VIKFITIYEYNIPKLSDKQPGPSLQRNRAQSHRFQRDFLPVSIQSSSSSRSGDQSHGECVTGKGLFARVCKGDNMSVLVPCYTRTHSILKLVSCSVFNGALLPNTFNLEYILLSSK
jgi:hypothetical protein